MRPTKWYNGVVHQIAITDKIDDSKGILELNRVEGSASDPNARIWPFKVMRQAAPRPGEQHLVVNHVYGERRHRVLGNFDYEKSIKAGMDYAGLPYSGPVRLHRDADELVHHPHGRPKEDALEVQGATPPRMAAWRDHRHLPAGSRYATAGLTCWAA